MHEVDTLLLRLSGLVKPYDHNLRDDIADARSTLRDSEEAFAAMEAEVERLREALAALEEAQ